MKNEIEAKFLNIDKESIRTTLAKDGFVLAAPEYLMRRKTFSFEHVAPGRNKWGRVRQEFDKITMTVKEVLGDGINDVYEIEIVVDDFNRAANLFEACNIPTKSSQENYREVWRRDGTEVTIDTWPGLRPFIEIESSDEASVFEVAGDLGFVKSEAVFGSIDTVYEKALGIAPSVLTKLPKITFDAPPEGS